MSGHKGQFRGGRGCEGGVPAQAWTLCRVACVLTPASCHSQLCPYTCVPLATPASHHSLTLVSLYLHHSAYTSVLTLVSSHLHHITHSYVLIPVSYWLHLHHVTHTCVLILASFCLYLCPHTCILTPVSSHLPHAACSCDLNTDVIPLTPGPLDPCPYTCVGKTFQQGSGNGRGRVLSTTRVRLGNKPPTGPSRSLLRQWGKPKETSGP